MSLPGNRPIRSLGVSTWLILAILALVLFFADELGSLLPLPESNQRDGVAEVVLDDQRTRDPGNDAAGSEQFSELPTVSLSQLPSEALDTLRLIAEDGPFPFSRDGLTFQNRERLLPLRPQGHYREYTVITPGSPDRGARRIVAGAEGERYYTDDHYNTFREIVEP